ncbi:MAG: hypothetical protein ACYCXW_06235 [Solirubrobacteraceae bacterium]
MRTARTWIVSAGEPPECATALVTSSLTTRMASSFAAPKFRDLAERRPSDGGGFAAAPNLQHQQLTASRWRGIGGDDGDVQLWLQPPSPEPMPPEIGRSDPLAEGVDEAMHRLGLLTCSACDDRSVSHAGRVLEPGTAGLAEG